MKMFASATLHINGKFLAHLKDFRMTSHDPWPNKYTGRKGPRSEPIVLSGILLREERHSTHTRFYAEADLTGKDIYVDSIDNSSQKWHAGDTIWWGNEKVFIVPRHSDNQAIELARYLP